ILYAFVNSRYCTNAWCQGLVEIGLAEESLLIALVFDLVDKSPMIAFFLNPPEPSTLTANFGFFIPIG
ncbi:MAG TPA: hypothetical protein VLZ10_20285, partial [Thermodesulfobacteriota bacterium]|nr:hypothetical protein [Thermodesulfobacteriota bacterium]